MKQATSWEANSRSSRQEIPNLYEIRKFIAVLRKTASGPYTTANEASPHRQVILDQTETPVHPSWAQRHDVGTLCKEHIAISTQQHACANRRSQGQPASRCAVCPSEDAKSPILSIHHLTLHPFNKPVNEPLSVNIYF
jgi:hypothetical protein